jgi:glycosyltransferase involved in cell wall biosynthesis
MPSIEGGGVEKNLFLISNFLSNKINNICLITASNEFKNKFKKLKFITPFFNLAKYGRILKYIFCLYELLKQIVKKEDIIILSFQANLYCILISKLFNTKIIVRSNSSPSGWSKNFIKKKLFKLILRLADTIIVNSNDFKEEFKKKFNLSTVMIYNPLNKNEIIKLSKKKINFPFFDKSKNDLKLINIGRFTDQKDQMTLLKSVNELKNKINVRLLIIGRGINLYKLKKFINDNKINKIVKILNFKENPFPYLKKADLFLLTSKFEGLPNVLLEAATLKKNIISTDCPTGPREILNNGKYGILCDVGNYKQISKKIIYCKTKNKSFLKRTASLSYKSLDRFDYKFNLNKYYLEIKKLN